MSTTPNLNLPYLASGQAQKHVTLNESLRMLDAIVQLSVVTRTLATPPGSPTAGSAYIVAASPTGAWVSQTGKIAAFQDGGWIFYPPKEGWLAWVQDEDKLYAYDGTNWVVASGGTQNLTMVGINATADATNRLSVSATAILLNHAGAGHQLKINKANAASTASLLYQTGFSGRAEMGLAGDDKFRVKVSADGSTWKDAVAIDPASAGVGMGVALSTQTARLQVETADANGGWFISTAAAGATAGGGAGAYSWPVPGAAGDRLGSFLFGSLNAGSGSAANAAGVFGHADAAWTVGSSHSSHLRFETTPVGSTTRAERLRITGAGKVGVGTTAPTTALHVNGEVRVGSYTVAGVPAASTSGAGAIIYVSNESGGAVLAFSDGTNWRRVTDRAAIS